MREEEKKVIVKVWSEHGVKEYRRDWRKQHSRSRK
jgi:hypothetical protein